MVASARPTPFETDEQFFQRVVKGQSAVGGKYKVDEFRRWLDERNKEVK
jgi:hypothetical protein